MAILNLEEIEETLTETVDVPLEEQEELPLEEMQEVQQDTQSLEDATELLEDMEEAAQQQAVTINNIEGDASEINSVEDGEGEVEGMQVDVAVEPEFTKDDIENNPEMVQDVVNEHQAAMEGYAVRLANNNGKNMRTKLFNHFGITAVSHESIRTNPFEAYKVTHEGLKETIKKVVIKIKEFIEKVTQSIMNVIRKFRVWLGQSKKDIEIIAEAKKYVSAVKDIKFSNTSGLLINPMGVVGLYGDSVKNILQFINDTSASKDTLKSIKSLSKEVRKTIEANQELKSQLSDYLKTDDKEINLVAAYFNGSILHVLSNMHKPLIMSSEIKANEDKNILSAVAMRLQESSLVGKDISGIVNAAEELNKQYKKFTDEALKIANTARSVKYEKLAEDGKGDSYNLKNISKVVSFANGMTVGYINTYRVLIKACKAIIKAGKSKNTVADLTAKIVEDHKK